MIQLKKVSFVVGFIEKSYLQVGGVKWVYMLDNLRVYFSVIKAFVSLASGLTLLLQIIFVLNNRVYTSNVITSPSELVPINKG